MTQVTNKTGDYDSGDDDSGDAQDRWWTEQVMNQMMNRTGDDESNDEQNRQWGIK